MLHKLLKNKKLVLASGSPRRQELLNMLGLDFAIMIPDIDESMLDTDHRNPRGYITRIASEKCRAIICKTDPDSLVIAADTIVYFQKEIYIKPGNQQEAEIILTRLSGQTHIVYTAIAIGYQNKLITEIAKTSVKFSDLSKEEILQYIATTEPMDKAGGYGIQGYGAQIVEKINGCYFNVMGFPINMFYEMIKSLLLK